MRCSEEESRVLRLSSKKITLSSGKKCNHSQYQTIIELIVHPFLLELMGKPEEDIAQYKEILISKWGSKHQLHYLTTKVNLLT